MKIWEWLNGKKRRISVAALLIAQALMIQGTEESKMWALYAGAVGVLFGGADAAQLAGTIFTGKK